MKQALLIVASIFLTNVLALEVGPKAADGGIVILGEDPVVGTAVSLKEDGDATRIINADGATLVWEFADADGSVYHLELKASCSGSTCPRSRTFKKNGETIGDVSVASTGAWTTPSYTTVDYVQFNANDSIFILGDGDAPGVYGLRLTKEANPSAPTIADGVTAGSTVAVGSTLGILTGDVGTSFRIAEGEAAYELVGDTLKVKADAANGVHAVKVVSEKTLGSATLTSDELQLSYTVGEEVSVVYLDVQKLSANSAITLYDVLGNKVEPTSLSNIERGVYFVKEVGSAQLIKAVVR